MKDRIIFYLALTIILLMVNCNSTQKKVVQENLIHEVLKNIDFNISDNFSNFKLDFESVEFNSEKETTHKFSDGSEIKIPANTFATLDGKVVSGDIEIKFKSIKTPGEIISSGLHLFYNNGDTIQAFTTGGMFEIDAEKDGQKLKINDGKSISINYASIDSAKYNFYYYDNVGNNWNYLSEANNFGKNYEKEEFEKEKQSENNSSENIVPVKFDEEKDFIIMVDLDYSKFPEISKYKNVMWKYTGSETQEKITMLLNQKWKKTNFTRNNNKSGEYIVELITDIQSVKIEISPVFSTADYNKAVGIYNAENEAKNKEFTSTSNNNYVSREVSIISLGVYNIDVCGKADAYGIYADFEFSDENYNKFSNDCKYFVISKNGQMITRYNLNSSDIVAFYIDTDNKILSILPDNKVAVLSSYDFENLNISPRQNFTFKLNVIDQIVENEDQLDEIIASL